MSELLGNVVRYQGDGCPVTLTLWHEGGAVCGELRHPRANGPRPQTSAAVLEEVRALEAEEIPEVEELADGGRGLLVVRGYAASFTQVTTGTELVSVWRLGGCECVRRRA